MNIEAQLAKVLLYAAYWLWVPYAHARDAANAVGDFVRGYTACERRSEARWRAKMDDMRKHASMDIQQD